MQLVTCHIHISDTNKEIVPIKADRRTLSKRRWRGVAEDGTEFGFDLPHPLANQTPFFETEGKRYQIDQLPESVIRIPFSNSHDAAYRGWMVGNMHFSASFEENAVIAEDDPAVRQMLQRNKIHFEEGKQVFEPTIVTSGHHH